MDRLASSVERLIEAVRQILEAHARTVGIGITAQHAHQSHAIPATIAHADESGKRLTRPMRKPVEIPGDRQLCLSHCDIPKSSGCARASRGESQAVVAGRHRQHTQKTAPHRFLRAEAAAPGNVLHRAPTGGQRLARRLDPQPLDCA